MAKTKDPYLEKILPPVMGAVVGGVAGALATGLIFYLLRRRLVYGTKFPKMNLSRR